MANKINLQGGQSNLQGANSNLQGGSVPLQGGNQIALAPKATPMGMQLPNPSPKPPAQPLLRTTAPAQQVAAPQMDLSNDYANVGGIIYHKPTNTAFANPQDFFQHSGQKSFDNLTFDSQWQPPTSVPQSGMQTSSQNTQMTSLPPNYSDLVGQAQQLSQLSPEEVKAQNELINLNSSVQTGLNDVENQPIPMPFITGQQAAIQRMGNIQTQTVQQRLALAQAQRQNNLTGVKTALDYLKPQSISMGQQLVNPATGAQVASAPSYTGFSNPLSPSGVTIYNQANGQQSGGAGGGLLPGLANGGTAPTSQVSTTGAGDFAHNAKTAGSAAAVNNPLGIKPGGKFSQYQTPEQGFQAGVDLVKKYQSGGIGGISGNSSLTQMVNTWITGSPNGKPTGYSAANVAQVLGVSPNTPISQIDPTQLAGAIARFETGYAPQGQGGQGQSASLTASNNTPQQYTGNPIVDSTIQQLLNGVPPSQIPVNDSVKQLANTYATQIDSNYNPANNELNYKNTQQAQTNAVPLQQAAQTASDHLAALKNLAAKVGYSNSPMASDVRTWWSNTVKKDSNIQNLQSAIGVIRGEIAKVLGGGTTTVESLQEAQSILPGDLSPQNIDSVIAQVTQLMNDKIKEYTNPGNIPQAGVTSSPSTQNLNVTKNPTSNYNFKFQ